MDDYGFVMLACHLVIIGRPDVRREFRCVCGARPASRVLGGVGSPGLRRKFRRVSEVPM
jgi:hypothetical protein